MNRIKHLFSEAVAWFVRVHMYLGMMIGFRPKFHYVDKSRQSRRLKGPALIIANHTAFYDPPMVWSVFPHSDVRTIAGEVLYEDKRLKWLLTQCRCIRIDRGAIDISCTREVIDKLKEGKCVGIFPEGRMNTPENGILPFHSGTALFAAMANVPIVPVYIGKKYEILGCRQHIVIGTPYELSSRAMTPDNLQLQADALRNEMLKMKESYEKGEI